MNAKVYFRNARQKSFTQTSNDMLWDSALSLEAKALLSIFLSNSEDWKINMAEIVKRSKNGRDAHYRVLNDLIYHGYIARVEYKNKSTGRFEKLEYIFSDDKKEVEQALKDLKQEYHNHPEINIIITYCVKKNKSKKKKSPLPENQDTDKVPFTENQDMGKNPIPENQDTDKQDSENSDSENQYINNTKLNNTNINNTKLDNTKLLIKKKKKKEIIKEIINSKEEMLILTEFLINKGLKKDTVYDIIINCYDQGVINFTLSDLEKQYEHMIHKLEIGEIHAHTNFPLYFANGLKMMEEQYNSMELHNKQEEMKRLIEEQEREKRQSVYYNWLEE